MRDIMAITKALADHHRLRVLMLLGAGELCVCQITDVMELAPSTVSKHLSILNAARLVESRKDGRWVYYRLPAADAPPAVRQALAWLTSSLADDRAICADLERLRNVLSIPREDLCRAKAKR